MKITLEFNNAEEFYRDLPKFAALTGFAGQFANFEHVKKGDSVAALKDPDLPKVKEKDGKKYLEMTTDQADKVHAAEDVAAATKTAEKVKKSKAEDPLDGNMNPPESDDTAEAPAKAKKAEAKAAAPGIAEVRKVLHTVIKAGHRDEMKELLSKLGAPNVTHLDPSKYEEFIAEAKKIGGIEAGLLAIAAAEVAAIRTDIVDRAELIIRDRRQGE